MIVALVVSFAFLMTNLDSNVMLTALPQMAKELGTSPAHLSIAITAYAVSYAVFVPVSGWLADRLGPRTVFTSAMAIFTVASILCAVSNGLLELTFFRIVEGLGAAMMVPVGRLILLRTFDKSQFLRAMSYATLPGLLGPILGPPLGGFITTFASWRWIFIFNVPFGLIGIALALLLIRNDHTQERRPFDWLGFVFVGVSVSAVMYLATVATRPETSLLEIAVLVVVSLTAGVGVYVHERIHPAPLLDLNLLRLPTFRAMTIGGSLFNIALTGAVFLQPIMLQIGFGMSAFESGLFTLWGAIGFFISRSSPRPVLRRFGFRTVLVWGSILSGLVVLLNWFFTPDSPYAFMAFAFLAGGLTRSMVYLSLNTICFSEVPESKMSGATGFSSMVQQLASGMGATFGAIILQFSVTWGGRPMEALTATDVQNCLLICAVLGCLSGLTYLSLSPEAGAAFSGHKPANRPKAA